MAEKTEKNATERRVHVLPVELLERVRAYQAANNIPSEVEAVRRLLNEALQSRDTINDVMKQVQDAFKAERDLRLIARDVLSSHILVTRIDISDNDLTFVLKNAQAGSIDQTGQMKTGSTDEQGWISLNHIWPEPKHTSQKRPKPPQATESWDAPTDGSLDDEIPF